MAAVKEKASAPKFKVIIGPRGGIVFDDPEGWHRYRMAFCSREMHLVLKRITKDRSRQEEKYFHAVPLRMIAEEMGIDRDEAKLFLREMFLKVEVRAKGGKRYTRIMSTTELGDQAYREFWEACIRWAALPTKEDGLGPDSGLELYIPYPNEIDWEDSF